MSTLPVSVDESTALVDVSTPVELELVVGASPLSLDPLELAGDGVFVHATSANPATRLRTTTARAYARAAAPSIRTTERILHVRRRSPRRLGLREGILEVGRRRAERVLQIGRAGR